MQLLSILKRNTEDSGAPMSQHSKNKSTFKRADVLEMTVEEESS